MRLVYFGDMWEGGYFPRAVFSCGRVKDAGTGAPAEWYFQVRVPLWKTGQDRLAFIALPPYFRTWWRRIDSDTDCLDERGQVRPYAY